MKRRYLLSLMCAVCLVCSMLCINVMIPTSAADSDTMIYVRKHVSLLYDDSGSMQLHASGSQNYRWEYASYATQAFTGLLNDTDSLTITYMSGDSMNVDLSGDRNAEISQICERTSVATSSTPFESIDAALEVLTKEGLDQEADDSGEQYWLVLMTDGCFFKNGDESQTVSEDELASRLQEIMDTYSNVNLIYFAMGAPDAGTEQAIDLSGNRTLSAYSSFHPFYAEGQEQIVSTMQTLSNQLSSRYSVSDGIKIDGNKVELSINSEISPIRNIAILAQQTDAQLQSVTSSTGTQMVINRQASLNYPKNASYTNIPSDTKGGCTALVTTKDGSKVPAGTITLVFSQEVDPDNFTLMYEPAIYLNMKIERKDGSAWVEVPTYEELNEGDTIRVTYDICEDGTNTPLDTAKLFGETTESITVDGKSVKAGEEVTLGSGKINILANVSMMDGGLQVSATRTLTSLALPTASDFSVTSSGPIEIRKKQLADNTSTFIDFTVTIRGKKATVEQLGKLQLSNSNDSKKSLGGEVTLPEDGVIRFTPKDSKAEVGDYTVSLSYDGTTVATEKVSVLKNEATYTAQTDGGIVIMSNVVGTNTESVDFTVTKHSDDGDALITAEDSSLFTVVCTSADGQEFKGTLTYGDKGIMSFTPCDASAVVGDYTVELKYKDSVLAKAPVSVLLYNATYTVEAVTEGGPVKWMDLKNNTAYIAFIIRADGEAVSAAQLEAMLKNNIRVQSTPISVWMSLKRSIGTVNGEAALIYTPTGNGPFILRNLLVCWRILPFVNSSSITASLKLTVTNEAAAAGSLDASMTGFFPWLVVSAIIFAILAHLASITLAILLGKKIFRRGAICVHIYTRSENGWIRSYGKSIKVGGLLTHLFPFSIKSERCTGPEGKLYYAYLKARRRGILPCFAPPSTSYRTNQRYQVAGYNEFYAKHKEQPISDIELNDVLKDPRGRNDAPETRTVVLGDSALVQKSDDQYKVICFVRSKAKPKKKKASHAMRKTAHKKNHR